MTPSNGAVYSPFARPLELRYRYRNVPVVLGVTLVGALAVVLGSLLADLLYAVVDPRVREQR